MSIFIGKSATRARHSPMSPVPKTALFASLVILSGFTTASADPYFTTRVDDSAPHVRVGLSVRKMRATFDVSTSGGFGSTFTPTMMDSLMRGSGGDPGLFRGGPAGVTYDDGSIAGEGFDDGNGIVTINSASQLRDSGRPAPAGADFPLQEVLFHASETVVTSTSLGRGSLTGGGPAFQFSDEEVVVGPYVDFVFPCLEGPGGGFLDFVVGYRFYDGSLGTGYQDLGIPQFTGGFEGRVKSTDYEYRYDYLGDADAGSAYPYTSSGLVYDPDLFAAFNIGSPSDYLPPSKTSKTTRSTIISDGPLLLQAFSRTTIDVDLHEIPVGFDCGCEIGRSTLAFSAGATVNIVDLSLRNRTDWFIPGVPTPAATQATRSSTTPVKVGGYVGTTFTCPLNESGDFRFEAHASYRWVPAIGETIGNTYVELDLSSWEGGAGFVKEF